MNQELGTLTCEDKVSASQYCSVHVRFLTFWVSDGKIHINTPYSRLLGKAPIMVSGMTTVKVGFVSAILEVGYHVELADGGHYSPAVLCAKVAESKGRFPRVLV